MTSRSSPKKLSLQVSIGNKDRVSTCSMVEGWAASQGCRTGPWVNVMPQASHRPPSLGSDRWACQ